MMFDLEESLLEKATQKEIEDASDENDDEGAEQAEDEGVGISLERLNPPALVLLGVEEPENHLAPHYLGRIMERLLRLSKSARGQVLLTSHSPSIMSRVEPGDVRYLRLNPDKETIVRKILLPPDADEAFKYVSEGVRAYPELYFSTLVVLGEGDSERVVLPRVASALGVPMDRNFVSFVPLGGRHVNHFWKLLSDLDIPYVTLLDLDLEREGGGWGRIKYACKELLKLGIKRKDLLEVTDKSGANRVLSSNELDEMHTWTMNDKDDLKDLKPWLDCLERFSVFFTYPLDLDFAMLNGFPDAYLATAGDGKGPSIPEKGSKEYKERLRAAREAVLKGEASKGIVDSVSDETFFFWYRYLFLNRGKPSTHFQALSSISDEQLVSNIPKVIKRLVDRMNKKLDEHQ